MKFVEILDTGGKIIGFVNVRRLPSRPAARHGDYIELPVCGPVSERFDPSVDWEEMTYCKATLQWHEVRFFDGSGPVGSRWFLVARELPDDLWRDDAFIKHVWREQ